MKSLAKLAVTFAAFVAIATMAVGQQLTDAERRGRDTWYAWTGGGEEMWREIARMTAGRLDLLRYVADTPRARRFEVLGVVNQPGCRAATAPDDLGLMLDVCPTEPYPDLPGRSTGIIGLRLFDNARFDRAAWDRVGGYRGYLKGGSRVEPPYNVGMACGWCHVGLSPTNPPADPAEPGWSNLDAGIGNQFLREGRLFSQGGAPNDFITQVGEAQPAGTSDTSRVATDHTWNPSSINSIANLRSRRRVEERMADGSKKRVPRVLKDGSDSRGLDFASARVYVNIGACHEIFFASMDPVAGVARPQAPFDIEEAERECSDWRDTWKRLPDVEAFLNTLRPSRLKDAPGGSAHMTAPPDVVRRGAALYAERCAACHSSHQPDTPILRPDELTAFHEQHVLEPTFPGDDYLADDERWSAALLGSNLARAMGSNPAAGHVWDAFSSATFKEMEPIGEVSGLRNPVDRHRSITIEPARGQGYYRTPSLASLWAHAPYLHGNWLGDPPRSPSVDDRVAAFEDGIERMLGLRKRRGVIPRTDRETKLALASGSTLTIPRDFVIALMASVDRTRLPKVKAPDSVDWLLGSSVVTSRILPKYLLRKSSVPDFVMDRGHEFGVDLSDADKRALVEFLKTL